MKKIVAGLCILALAGCGASSLTLPEIETTTVPIPVATLTEGVVSDGIFEVGPEIKPGKYKTAGPDKDSIMPVCYFERKRDLDDNFESIIANEAISGPATMKVGKGDAYVEFSGGCVWKKV